MKTSERLLLLGISIAFCIGCMFGYLVCYVFDPCRIEVDFESIDPMFEGEVESDHVQIIFVP